MSGNVSVSFEKTAIDDFYPVRVDGTGEAISVKTTVSLILFFFSL
jgi:hypothetical protein